MPPTPAGVETVVLYDSIFSGLTSPASDTEYGLAPGAAAVSLYDDVYSPAPRPVTFAMLNTTVRGCTSRGFAPLHLGSHLAHGYAAVSIADCVFEGNSDATDDGSLLVTAGAVAIEQCAAAGEANPCSI